MNVYSFRGTLICEECGNNLIEEKNKILSSIDPEDENVYPQGPFSNGGGESDIPQHCDICHNFLENPLTPEGETHLKYIFSRDSHQSKNKIDQWKTFYNYLLENPH